MYLTQYTSRCVALSALLTSLSVLAGSSSVIYPKINNNGNSWRAPSAAHISDDQIDMVGLDQRELSQLLRDAQFSHSLRHVCGEVSALFYRYLHDQPRKPLFHGNAQQQSGLQHKEALPFISRQSQYYEKDMQVEYPMPSLTGEYHGQFVYQLTLKGGAQSIFQLAKNTGGGNAKNKQILFAAYLHYFTIDNHGHKQGLGRGPSRLLLKIDRLTTIKGFRSESHAFEQGQQHCQWLSTQRR